MTNHNKKIFFISDFHLGAPNYVASLEREKIIVQFLEEIKNDAAELFIVGDMFDFWYEYRQVVPKGYVRLLGKLAELSDAGIPMHFFVGNHDMWMKDYFIKELNIPVYYKAKEFERNGKKFLIGHGDGLGPGACTTGTMTICAMRSIGSMVNAALPRFQQLTISGPW